LLKVLFVEDYDSLRESYKEFFEMWGLEVVAVSDGNQAMEQIEKADHFDLLITDGQYEGYSSIEVVKRFLQKFPQAVPVIVISGSFNTWYGLEQAGAHIFFNKPCPPDAFKQFLQGIGLIE